MRMNLKNFEIFVTSLLIVSLIGVLSILPGVRYICMRLIWSGKEERRRPFFTKKWREL